MYFESTATSHMSIKSILQPIKSSGRQTKFRFLSVCDANNKFNNLLASMLSFINVADQLREVIMLF